METKEEKKEGGEDSSDEESWRRGPCVPWTPAQVQALSAFIQRDMAEAAAAKRSITPFGLARRAKALMPPEQLGGARSAHSIRHKVLLILAKGGEGAQAASRDYWTPVENAAVEEFVRREEERAVAAGRKAPSTRELTHRAVERLVPGLVGARSWGSVNSRIRMIRSGEVGSV